MDISLLLAYILTINTLTYILMWVDKMKSIYGWWRISERTLWTLALIGGAGGIWLGMTWPIYHKAGKRSFRAWIPMLAICYLVLVVWFL